MLENLFVLSFLFKIISNLKWNVEIKGGDLFEWIFISFLSYGVDSLRFVYGFRDFGIFVVCGCGNYCLFGGWLGIGLGSSNRCDGMGVMFISNGIIVCVGVFGIFGSVVFVVCVVWGIFECGGRGYCWIVYVFGKDFEVCDGNK